MFSFGGIPQKKEWHLPPTKKKDQKKACNEGFNLWWPTRHDVSFSLLPTKCVIWASWLTHQGLKFLTYEITVIVIMIINKSK